jgi:hypothetical protein
VAALSKGRLFVLALQQIKRVICYENGMIGQKSIWTDKARLPTRKLGFFRQTTRFGIKDFDQLLLCSLIQPTVSKCKTKTSLLNRPLPLIQRKIRKSKDKKNKYADHYFQMFAM